MTTILAQYNMDAGNMVELVIANNDEMALGAYEAIKAAGREDEIVVVGCDCNIDAVQSIRDGGLSGTVDKRWYNLGYDGATNLITASSVMSGSSSSLSRARTSRIWFCPACPWTAPTWTSTWPCTSWMPNNSGSQTPCVHKSARR